MIMCWCFLWRKKNVEGDANVVFNYKNIDIFTFEGAERKKWGAGRKTHKFYYSGL